MALEIRQKTCGTDLSYFADLVRKHLKAKLLHPKAASKTIKYMEGTYFKHFNLYKYGFNEK